MASTQFTDYSTVVRAAWLNDVNTTVYGIRQQVIYATEVGADPTGVVECSALLQGAINTGKKLILNGVFNIATSLIPTQAGICGISPKYSGLLVNGAHAITIPATAGFDRYACIIENFGINSISNSCDDKFAIYVPGVANGAAAVYNSGLTVRDLEIGRGGRMGGGFYIKDLFRGSFYDVGMTDVSRMIQIVGSVVQCKFHRITSNNDSAASSLSRIGISTSGATYSSGTLTPENVSFVDCSYIRGDVGVQHTAGLLISFSNFDTEADSFGAVVNAPVTMYGGILAPGINATGWVGISRGVAISNPDDSTIFEEVDINCLRAPATPASSYGIDAGDGASPVYGLTVKNCRIRGIVGSLASAIRARINNGDATFYNNDIRSAVATGTTFNVQSGRNVVIEDNTLPGGTLVVNDMGDVSAGGRIINNSATSLTATLSSDNWTVYNPAISGNPTRGTSELKGTFTGTLTGCTTSPTGTLRYVIHNRIVVLYIPSFTGTSNTTSCSITGLPAAIIPNRTQDIIGRGTDNGVNGITGYRVGTGGTIDMFFGASLAGWTAAGTKGANNCTITYSLE